MKILVGVLGLILLLTSCQGFGGEDNKYYVGGTKGCLTINYLCDEGWDSFSDVIGCGCERVKK